MNPPGQLSPNVSHVILELSDNFTAANWWDHSGGTDKGIGTYAGGASDPGWPAGESIYGGKIEDLNEGGVQVFSFYSDRAPQWSDFYAKGGSASFAYNTSFGVAVDNPNTYWLPAMAGQTALHKILAPDTVTVPIPAPAAASLGVVGLSLVSLVRRRMA